MYEKLHEHWSKYGPPVHIAAAAFMGFKPKKQGRWEDLENMFGSSGIIQ